MANTKIKATAQLFLDTSDAKNDAKKFITDLKQQLNSIETAADKMTVFKDLVGYIAMADKNLASLISNNGDKLRHMFDGIDKNSRNMFEDLFGISGENLKMLDTIREKLATLTPKSSIKDVREFAKDLNSLYEAIGQTPDFKMDDFVGRVNADMVKAVTDAFNKFDYLWTEKISSIKDNFSIGGVGGAGGAGGLSEEVQKEIDKLKKQKDEYQEIIDMINKPKSKAKVQTTAKSEIEEMQKLIDLYKEKETAVDSARTDNERTKALGEQVRLAILLKNTMDYVADNGSAKGQMFVAKNTGKDDVYTSVETFLNQFYDKSNQQAQKVRELYQGLTIDVDEKIKELSNAGVTTGYSSGNTQEIRVESDDYNKLNENIKEYISLQKQISKFKEGSKERNDILNRQQQIQSEILQMKELSEDQEGSIYSVFDEIDEDVDVKLEDAVSRLANALQIDIPQATNTAGSAFKQVGDVAQEAAEKLKAFYELTDLIQSKDASREMTDVDIGQYTERLNTAEQELKALGDQGIITSEELEKVDNALTISRGALSSSEYRNSAQRRVEAGNESESIPDDGSSDAMQENEQHKALLNTIHLVEEAINNKTAAFKTEASTVDSVVTQEIESLGRLKEYLELLKTTAQSIFSGNNKKIGFHYGNLDHYVQTGDKSENFKYQGDSLRSGNWGSFGTGIYYLSDPNAFVGSDTVPQGRLDKGQKFYAMDLSKYNLYMAQTSEQAESLYNFLNKLQKFVMSASSYRGFDEELQC